MTATIVSKALDGKRLSEEEGLALLSGSDLLTLGMLANQARGRLHPERRVSFVIDRNINYTNTCVTGCRFCAFYRPAGHPEAYVLSRAEIFEKIEETVAVGGTQILMQGGLNPDLDLNYFEDLFTAIKKRYPIKLHSLSPVEIDYLAGASDLSLEVVISRLAAAGLDSIAGGGAEILVDRVRRLISPRKTGAGRWLEVMRAAHRAGLKSTATMMFGSVETLADRIAHLEAIRRLQDETGGFTAFIPWSFQPGHTKLGGSPSTAVDYLRTLAAARIYLDNVPNLQVSWVTQGVKIAQIALAFGANDFGSTMLEENVVRAAGVGFSASLQELVHSIKEAGYQPAQRDNLYNIIRTF
ncbi:MAG: cyclic dehypoxanthinyl futalosine synthase [Desulfotomaculaceae bacterium]